MSDGNWPDKERPGFPLMPEHSRAHTLIFYDNLCTWLWNPRHQMWVDEEGDMYSPLMVGKAKDTRYCGVCVTEMRPSR